MATCCEVQICQHFFFERRLVWIFFMWQDHWLNISNWWETQIPLTNSSMLRPLWCGAYCKTHIWSTSICTNTNICLTDLYDASMVSSGLIYKLEKLADEAILSEALAIIPLWKFRAKTPPGFWNSKLHLITSPCLQNSNQETPQPPPPFSIV